MVGVKKSILIAYLSILPAIAEADSDLIGEIGIAGGGAFPQGNFVTYSDPGPTGIFRINSHIRPVELLSIRFDLSGVYFSGDEEAVFVESESVVFPAKKIIEQYSFSLHVGLQLGSDTRRGAIRPRAAIAPGVYLFNTETSVRLLDTEEQFFGETDSQFRLGWRGVVGTDIFFTAKWGISLDFVHDQVWNLHRVLEADEFGKVVESSRSARFHSFIVGVVIPFEAMDES